MTADEVARKELCLSRVDFDYLYELRRHMWGDNPNESPASLWKEASSLLDIAYRERCEEIGCEKFIARWQENVKGELIPFLTYYICTHSGGELSDY